MLINRRKLYCKNITTLLTSRPELVNAFVIAICDEISMIELKDIYKQLEAASNEPIPKKLIKIMEN